MLHKYVLATVLMCAHGNVVFAEPIVFIESPTIYLANTNNLQVNKEAQSTFESFTRNWSQFEILVSKENFPIPAPNCKKTIQIRFKGIEPKKGKISAIQQSRWELLERIRKNDQADFSSVFLKVDTNNYMQKSADGKYTLDYCNVFVE